jgi:hypothetical protein
MAQCRNESGVASLGRSILKISESGMGIGGKMASMAGGGENGGEAVESSINNGGGAI